MNSQDRTYRCMRCGEQLDPEKIVWLELNTRTGSYTNEPVPEIDSQGGFEFGAKCAKRVLANGGKRDW